MPHYLGISYFLSSLFFRCRFWTKSLNLWLKLCKSVNILTCVMTWVREGWPYPNVWIFGKVPNGVVGGSFPIQKFMLQIFSIINASSVMYSEKKPIMNFRIWEGGVGVNGFLELCQEFIRFGSAIHPLTKKYSTPMCQAWSWFGIFTHSNMWVPIMVRHWNWALALNLLSLHNPRKSEELKSNTMVRFKRNLFLFSLKFLLCPKSRLSSMHEQES